jgi:hypothetical protein
MASKSKVKGSTYERDVSKFLCETYGGSFVRVPNSGAYIGGKNQSRTVTLSDGQIRSFKGDIIPPDDWKYFNCECKSYADFQFHQLFSPGEIPIMESWINQTMEVSANNDLNIIFMKFTRKGQYVAYQENTQWKTPHSIVYHSKKHGDWIFCGADKFWSCHSDKVKDVSINGVQSSRTP